MLAYNDPNITNNMYPRSHECISLRPKVNIQVTQKLSFLNSGIFLRIINTIPIISIDRIIKILYYWGGGEVKRRSVWEVNKDGQ